MGRGLKGIHQDKIKYDTHMNICKFPPSLKEAQKPDSVISAERENYGSERKNGIVTDMNESNYGSVKISSLSGM